MPIRRITLKRQKRSRNIPRQSGGQQKSEPGSIYVFYHIYCNKNTEAVVKDQAMRIIISGLYKKVKAVKCFIAGDAAIIEVVATLLQNMGSKFEIAEKGPGDITYERFTLLKIKKYIQPEDKFLYIHSKGVKDIAEFSGKPAPLENIYWWRTYMEYFLLGEHEKCLDALKTHDVVGVNYSTSKIGPHFSGNFWWSTGSYYMKLPNTIGPDYNDSEKYLFTANPRHLDLFPGDGDTAINKSKYSEPFYPKSYII
jgi:hypothetical protein